MILHYLRIAFRHLVKFRTYSIINLLGLIIGFTCFMLISFYIFHEFSYDQYHEKADRIYRLGLGSLKEDRIGTCISAGAMAQILQNEYAGIEKVVRIRHLPSLVAYEDNALFEEKFFFVDSTFFDVFTFQMLSGNHRQALTHPFSLVLTERSAIRYFGKSDETVLGKLIRVDESMTFTVTGIIKNPPDNSHFHFDMLASASTLEQHPQTRDYQIESWYAHYFYNYVLLEEGADATDVDKNIRHAAKQHSDPDLYQLYGTNMGLFLQPLTEIHLNPLRGELEPQGDRTVLYVLGIVALIIIVLASINYTNITTAQSIRRHVEVGIRKAMGAGRRQMTFQFLGESIMICAIALFLAVGVTDLVLPYFNTFSGKQLTMNLSNWSTLVFLLTTVGVTGVLGGAYPALIMGNFSPVKSLKKLTARPQGKLAIRKGIVIFQFTVSMVLVGNTFVIFSQVRHMLNKDLGLNPNRVIVIPTHGDPIVNQKCVSFFERLSQRQGVQNYSISEVIPGDPVYGIVARFEGKEIVNYQTASIDYGYLDTYRIKLKAGRNFSRDQPLDTMDRVIINESLAKYLGWTAEEAIGKRYDRGGDGENISEVIGVTEDFNFNSVKHNVQPIVMGIFPVWYQKISVRLGPGDLEEAIKSVRNAWLEVYPQRPFDFRFADELVEVQYQTEKKFGKLFLLFSVVAVSIGLLGLFGIASLELKFRAKEVSIRKVLGASVTELLITLSTDFARLTLIAFVLSLPLAYYLMSQWLSGFAYRVDAIFSFIIWPALGVVMLALLVVVLKTLRSTTINPAQTLRNE